MEVEFKPLKEQIESLEGETVQAKTKIEQLLSKNSEQEISLTRLKDEFEKLDVLYNLREQYVKQIEGEKKGLEGTVTDSSSSLTKSKEKLAKINEELLQTRQMLEQERDAFPEKLKAEYKRGKSEGKGEAGAEYDNELKKLQNQRERERRNLEAKLNEATTKGKRGKIVIEEVKKILKKSYEGRIKRKDQEILGLTNTKKELEIQVRQLKKRPTQSEYNDINVQSEAKGEQIKELQKRPTQADMDKNTKEVVDLYFSYNSDKANANKRAILYASNYTKASDIVIDIGVKKGSP